MKYLFKFKLRTTIPFECCKKNFVKNGYLKSRNLSEEKKPPRAQIFRYFRIESRNNKSKCADKSFNLTENAFCLKNSTKNAGMTNVNGKDPAFSASSGHL